MTFSEDAGQLIINKPLYSFAIKGGNNGEPHNHNDLGSFIYSDKDGQVFCDLGSGRYTKDYFDEEKRYGIFCNASLSHSVPIIEGKPHKATALLRFVASIQEIFSSYETAKHFKMRNSIARKGKNHR